MLAIGDRYLYIVTGKEAQKKLSNSKIEKIRKSYMNPQLKRERYFQAIEEGLTEIALALKKESNKTTTFGITLNGSFFLKLALVIFFIYVCILYRKKK